MSKKAPLQAACIAFILAAALSAWAQDRVTPSASASKLGAQPLKAPLKIDRSSVKLRTPPPVGIGDRVERAYAEFRRHYDEGVALGKRYQQRTSECLNRTYSVEDQRAARCRADDTVAACNEKLLNHCVQDVEPALSKSVAAMYQSGDRLMKVIEGSINATWMEGYLERGKRGR